VDLWAPCALGGIISDETITEIKARAICGLANNQLATEKHGLLLQERGITYIPDFVVNAGGMIGAGTRIFSEPTLEDSRNRVMELYDSILKLLHLTDQENKPTSVVANSLAEEILMKAKTN